MSYILDALRKSERERTVGQVPTLHTAADFDATNRGRRSLWLVLTLMVTLGAVAAGFLFWPQVKKLATRFGVVQVAELPPAAAPTTSSNASAPPPFGGAPPPEPIPAPQLAAPDSAPAPTPPAAPAQPVTVSPVALAPAAPPPTAPAGAPQLQELPVEFQRGLPKLAVNVVSYSEDAQRRFVMINAQVYTEGQRIAGGPQIERITAEGPILNHNGTRFLLRP